MMQLSTPSAILLGFLIASLIVLMGAKFFGQSVWIALTAIGTVGAVVVALFYPLFLRRYRRPILEIRPPGYDPEYLRWARDFSSKGLLFFVDIQIQNTGKSIARSCQPLLTAMGEMKGHNWQKEPNWVPIGLDWILDEYARQATGKPTEEKDVVPNRAYIFNLGYVTPKSPDFFTLAKYLIPTGQPESFGPGKYCFEITAFALEAQSVRNYFYVEWDGGCPTIFEEVKKKLRVYSKDHPPW